MGRWVECRNPDLGDYCSLLPPELNLNPAEKQDAKGRRRKQRETQEPEAGRDLEKLKPQLQRHSRMLRPPPKELAKPKELVFPL